MNPETPEESTSIRVLFRKGKETKNCAVFDELPPRGEDPHIRTLYLQKASWRALGSPEEIAVDISPL